MTIFEIRYSDFQSEPFSEQRGSASGPLAAPLGLVHYIHMGKTLETSHFLKMVCSMGETKNIPYPFWKIHCSMGKMIHFTKNAYFSVLLDH